MNKNISGLYLLGSVILRGRNVSIINFYQILYMNVYKNIHWYELLVLYKLLINTM